MSHTACTSATESNTKGFVLASIGIGDVFLLNVVGLLLFWQIVHFFVFCGDSIYIFYHVLSGLTSKGACVNNGC